MSETTTTTEAPIVRPDLPVHPADVLLYVLATFLQPMFVSGSGGDLAFARMAAIETINAYRARTHPDLIAIAQIIAFGLAALGSLSLSMVDDLSLNMILRLRGSANSSNRSAEQNRRALEKSHLDPANQPAIDHPHDPDDERHEAELIARITANHRHAEALHLRPPTPAPAPTGAAAAATVPAATQAPPVTPPPAPTTPATPLAPTSTAPVPSGPISAPPIAQTSNSPIAQPPIAEAPAAPTPAAPTPAAQAQTAQASATPIRTAPATPAPIAATPRVPVPTAPARAATPTYQTQARTVATAEPELTERRIQAMWGVAMNDVASEYIADLPNLAPAERYAAKVRANALSTCANQLMSGRSPPRSRPGDLNAIMRPNPT